MTTRDPATPKRRPSAGKRAGGKAPVAPAPLQQQLSAAPAPVTRKPWPPAPIAPDWVAWARRDVVGLDDAVALSLGAEPVWDQLLVNQPEDAALPHSVPGTRRRVRVEYLAGEQRTVSWHHPSLTTEEGKRRLELVRKHLGTSALPTGKPAAGGPAVRLHDLARFAQLQGWECPKPLLALLPKEQSHESVGSAPTVLRLGAQPTDAPVTVPHRKAAERNADEIRRALELSGCVDQPGHEPGHADPVKQRAMALLVTTGKLSMSRFRKGWTEYRAQLGLRP